MTRDAAIRRLCDYVDHSLNGAELAIRLKQYEAMAVADTTTDRRNHWRRAARETIAAHNEQRHPAFFEKVPAWAQEEEFA